ncbi:MAG: KpsF/GutQ family sugar-phosphate isomerase [Alphaproteobacteria bacterium]|nr:KpsF/GutQ family sugar-phosphate isomerase [Alphaproteobacteria bacterium]
MEAHALNALAGALDESFSDAIDLLAAARGRLIVTGMGKSGHVGNKIASTLSSTGTPSFFVHPAEASHGDLGMIVPGDAILAISNSGNTNELGDILSYCKRFTIPIVAITGQPKSILGEMADCTLVLPMITEACPMGLAPTTTTTAFMALGDAIAVALLERRGFTPDNFQVLHPGGSLGANLLRVSDLMHGGDEIPLVALDLGIADTLLVMTSKRFGCVGITDATGKLVGIITDGDLRRNMSNDLLQRTAGAIMTKDPLTIRPPALAVEALALMNGRDGKSITALFVVENDTVEGILHIHDCLRAGVK